MQKWNGQLLRKFDDDVEGNASVGTTVIVRKLSTGEVAELYTGSTTESPTKNNPFTTDSFGRYDFYAENGKYLVIFGDGSDDIEVTLFDPYDSDFSARHIVGSSVVCDGVTSTFAVAGNESDPDKYHIFLDGIRQTHKDIDGINNRWDITGAGQITFTTPPDNGVVFYNEVYVPVIYDYTADGIEFFDTINAAISAEIQSEMFITAGARLRGDNGGAEWVSSGTSGTPSTKDYSIGVVYDSTGKGFKLNTSKNYSPKVFECVGDGLVDDTTNLRNYLNVFNTWNISDGEYRYTSTMSFSDRRVVVSDVSNGKLLCDVPYTNDGSSTGIEFVRCHDSIISGLVIDFYLIDVGIEPDGYRDGVVFNNCLRTTLKSSKILGAPSQALSIREQCTGFRVLNNDIVDAGRKQQLNESGISIGGGCIIYNSAEVEVASNRIVNCWSACIFALAVPDEGYLFENVDNLNIHNNYIYESQSNGIRIQPDNYPIGDSCNRCTVNENIVINTSRTCIRINGHEHTVSNNICYWDKVSLNQPNTGIESNHGTKNVITSNVLVNMGAGVQLWPNGRVPYGCDDWTISNNIMDGCYYGFVRLGYTGQSFTGPCTNLKFINNTIINPERQHFNAYEINGVEVRGNSFVGLPTGVGFEREPAVLTKNSTEVVIESNKFKDMNDMISSINNGHVSINWNKGYDIGYNGMSVRDGLSLDAQGNSIRFNKSSINGVTGITSNNNNKVNIQNNTLSTLRSVTNTADSGILLAGQTFGIVSGNVIEATNGVNNQGIIPDGVTLIIDRNPNKPVLAKPVVTLNPVSGELSGGSYTMTVSATDYVSVQWFRDGVVDVSKDGLLSVSVTQTGEWFARFTNANGNTDTTTATVIAEAPATPPTIFSQPVSYIVPLYKAVDLNLGATNATSYQWNIDGAPISGATSSLYRRNVQYSDNGRSFTCTASNSAGSVLSSSVTLTPRVKVDMSWEDTFATAEATSFIAVEFRKDGKAYIYTDGIQTGVEIWASGGDNLSLVATQFSELQCRVTTGATHIRGDSDYVSATWTDLGETKRAIFTLDAFSNGEGAYVWLELRDSIIPSENYNGFNYGALYIKKVL